MYEEILDDKAEKEMNEQFKNVLDPIENSYKNYVDESRKELEKKIKGIEDGTIKSIEIISIFSAVIALLISNIMGITNLAAITLRTILIMNMSIVLSILFLLTFVRLLIKEKDNKKSFLMSLIIMGIFVLVSVVLVA